MNRQAPEKVPHGVPPGRRSIRQAVLYIGSALLLSLVCRASQTGSWGEQGDGTYRNPILDSNFPDNDVMRMGDTYYMMSSTNEFVPGMIILKSRDLVNWEFSNAIMPAPVLFDRDFDVGRNPAMANRGTWAGSFGYTGAEYLAYWCLNKRRPGTSGTYKIVFAKARSLEGPWSQPRELTWPDGSSIDSTDPGVLWDREAHKAWLACGGGEIYALSWDGERLLQSKDRGIVVTHTLRGEAAKLYKFDGQFFYMNAHVGKRNGVNQRMATFHRSRTIEGPWEGRIVLENGNGTDHMPSQGTLLRIDDGSWWFIHQLARGDNFQRYNGRPQMLEPVSWKDGWPLIGTDPDGDGVGKVVWSHAKPINGFPVRAPASDDEFDSPRLGLQWMWRFNPRNDRWSLAERPGFLRLKACVGLPGSDPESLKLVPNVIGQRLLGHHANVMTAKVDFAGMEKGQEGGLHISSGATSAIGVKRQGSGSLRLFFKSDSNGGGTMRVEVGPAVAQSNVWLQARVEGGIATFFYSLDGTAFTRLGAEARLVFSVFTPNLVGFYTRNTVEDGHMDIDWFHYDYNGPKGP